MDFGKLEGIVSAIESESQQPSPSHNNLARLVAMFCREMVRQLEAPIVSPAPASVTELAPSTEEVVSKGKTNRRKPKAENEGSAE